MRSWLCFQTTGPDGKPSMLRTHIDDESETPWWSWPRIIAISQLDLRNTTWWCIPKVDSEPKAAFYLHPESLTVVPEPIGVPKPMTSPGIDPEISDLTKRLSEPFPPAVLGRLNKGGRQLTYVPIAEVIVRLNDELGLDNWSTEIVKLWREDEDWLCAHMKLICSINGTTVIKEQVGGQQIKRTTQDKRIVDLGDEYKGAISDALKKCAQQLGIGIDLARKEDALQYEANKAAEKEAAQTAEVLAEEIAAIKADIATMIPKVKDRLRQWWATNQIPNVETLTPDLIQPVKSGVQVMLEKQKEYLALHPEEDPNFRGGPTAGDPADQAGLPGNRGTVAAPVPPPLPYSTPDPAPSFAEPPTDPTDPGPGGPSQTYEEEPF